MRRHALAVTLLTGALVLAACNDDGRTLAPAPTVPVSPLTVPPDSSVPLTPAPGGPEVGIGFALTSPDFVDGDVLDPTFTCDGLNVSPSLQISGTPVGAAELALSVVDVDGNGGIRWLVTGLAPTTTSFERGVTPPGAISARTSSGVVGWDGPCPPPSDPLHTYHFTAYALPEPLGVADGTDAADVLALLEDAAIARDTLVVFYGADGG